MVSFKIAKNLKKIWTFIILYLKRLAQSSVPIFTTQKTVFIQYTWTLYKSKYIEESKSLVILRVAVAPPIQVKILGVIFDQKLNYKAKIANALQEEVNAELTLKRLTNFSSEIAWTLFDRKFFLYLTMHCKFGCYASQQVLCTSSTFLKKLKA